MLIWPSAAMLASRSRTSRCVITSSALVGSSAISSGGRVQQRHYDQHPLRLPDADLAGESTQKRFRRRKTGSFEQPRDTFLLTGPWLARMCTPSLPQLSFDAQSGIQGRHGTLGHEADQPSAHLPQLALIAVH